MLKTRFAIVLMTVAVLAAGRPAQAVPPETFESVVSVLPLWPGYNQGGRVGAPPGQDPEGSGVAVLPGGLIATALHVIDRATKVDVRLADGRVFPAEVVGRDRQTDIALLRISEDLPTLAAAPEQAPGAPVCALSNAFGLDLSVTCGVVSALNRTGTGFNPVEDFVQTDAAVNPGSSGGALVDRQGRLVGMLSAIFAKRSDANIGVNFAVSRRLLLRVADDLAAFGEVRAAWSGITVSPLADASALARNGVMVSAVDPEGPGADIVQVGDEIVMAAGRSMTQPSDWSSAIYLHRPGSQIELRIRSHGQLKRVILPLQSAR